MGFRTVIIKERSKLDLNSNYLICRNSEENRIFIPEISCLVLESTAISVTSALLSHLIKNNVKVVFCDEKHDPESELVPYHFHYISSQRIVQQINWDKILCGKLWQNIIAEKINMQAKLLQRKGKLNESKMLLSYMGCVEYNDETNREGHSAKVYFNALFGKDFERRCGGNINSALNYGYKILLSCFNKEIVSKGYLTQLGIWHKNQYNCFNLSCDLMEPFRPIVDDLVSHLSDEDLLNFKKSVLQVLNKSLTINKKKYILEDVVSIYCQSIFNALNTNKLDKVLFYEW